MLVRQGFPAFSDDNLSPDPRISYNSRTNSPDFGLENAGPAMQSAAFAKFEIDDHRYGAARPLPGASKINPEKPDHDEGRVVDPRPEAVSSTNNAPPAGSALISGLRERSKLTNAYSSCGRAQIGL
jgi:hypothetical protein